MTRDEAINLLQVMLLDEREAPKFRPESFVALLRPALLERDVSHRLATARRRKAPLFIPPEPQAGQSPPVGSHSGRGSEIAVVARLRRLSSGLTH
jgi:hypothetical protein